VNEEKEREGGIQMREVMTVKTGCGVAERTTRILGPVCMSASSRLLQAVPAVALESRAKRTLHSCAGPGPSLLEVVS
jgi:hypothetical protein